MIYSSWLRYLPAQSILGKTVCVTAMFMISLGFSNFYTVLYSANRCIWMEYLWKRVYYGSISVGLHSWGNFQNLFEDKLHVFATIISPPDCLFLLTHLILYCMGTRNLRWSGFIVCNYGTYSTDFHIYPPPDHLFI